MPPFILLSDNQKNHVRNEVEDQKDDFKQPEKRVDNHIVGFSGDGEPFALHTVDQIRRQYTHDRPQGQKGTVYDCAPHKEGC